MEKYKVKVSLMRYFKLFKTSDKKDKLWIRVSKRVSKKAVIRNKIKRRIKSILREYNIDLSKYILSVLPSALELSFEQLKREIGKTIRWVRS